MNAKTIINHIVNNDDEAANIALQSVIMDKVKTALDVKQIELASSIYDGREQPSE